MDGIVVVVGVRGGAGGRKGVTGVLVNCSDVADRSCAEGDTGIGVWVDNWLARGVGGRDCVGVKGGLTEEADDEREVERGTGLGLALPSISGIVPSRGTVALSITLAEDTIGV